MHEDNLIQTAMTTLQNKNAKSAYAYSDAMLTLANYRYSPAIPYIVAISQGGDKWLRPTAAEALGKIGDVSAVPHLIELLDDPDEQVQQAAIEALGHIGDRSVVPILLRLLDASTENIFGALIRALGEIADPTSAPKLARLRDDPRLAGGYYAPYQTPLLRHFMLPEISPLRDVYADALETLDTPETIAALGPEGDPQKVFFTSYSPSLILPMQQYRVIVYAYHSEAASEIEHDIDTFAEQFAASLPKPKTAKQAPPLRPGAQIRVVPECDDLRFSPPFEVRRWFESWMRFDFRAEVKSHLVGETLFVRLSMQVAGIEIATIKLAVEVIEPSATGQSEPKLKNPLAAAKAKLSTVRMYNKIFISYSRKDSTVAHAYRLAQIAAGNDVFLDTESIRAGEDWQAALAHAIDDADILQLFWSEHSATSPNVRDEWDYALRHKCAADQCRTFIRPVYWVNPMPPPPPELAHLNFRFVPLRPIDVTGE